MAYTFKYHGERLMGAAVKADHVGGFMVQDADTETLFAVTKGGKVFSRKVARPNARFDQPNANWDWCKSVPDHAEWIGAYQVARLNG